MKEGDKLNKLTFICFVEPKIRNNGGKRLRGIFRCECGNEGEKDYVAVKTGHTKQCIKCGNKIVSEYKKTHGLIKHPLYRKWQDMKNRCYNSKVERYKDYGGRGITVCDEWKNSFEIYYKWCIENGYKKGLTLDRVDVNGNYNPNNCKYVTPIEQGFNKQNTFYVEINGEKYSLAKLMYQNGLSKKYGTVYTGLVRRKKSIEYYIDKLNLSIQ